MTGPERLQHAVASRYRLVREHVGLDASSRVLVVGTEGATDPVVYTRLVATTTN